MPRGNGECLRVLVAHVLAAGTMGGQWVMLVVQPTAGTDHVVACRSSCLGSLDNPWLCVETGR